MLVMDGQEKLNKGDGVSYLGRRECEVRTNRTGHFRLVKSLPFNVHPSTPPWAAPGVPPPRWRVTHALLASTRSGFPHTSRLDIHVGRAGSHSLFCFTTVSAYGLVTVNRFHNIHVNACFCVDSTSRRWCLILNKYEFALDRVEPTS